MILAFLGFGTIGASLFAGMTKYKPIFVLITGIMLLISYNIVEKKNDPKGKIIFWISAVVSISILYLPTILAYFSN